MIVSSGGISAATMQRGTREVSTKPRLVVVAKFRRFHHLATGALSIRVAKAKKPSRLGTAVISAVPQQLKAKAFPAFMKCLWVHVLL